MSILNVVNAGMCVGCGGCSVITGGKIPMKVDNLGVWQADPSQVLPTLQEAASNVCPFADESPNETEIATEEFPELPVHPKLGRYRSTFAARLTDQEYLEGSSSGGLTSWLLLQLLERGHIDGVLHVGSGNSVDGMFAYVVSHSADELQSRRKSIYYSTSMADAILSVRGNGKRYALVGVPCFITAGRLLARNDVELRSQLSYFLGLVCGHLKSSAFAELLAWQLGIPPKELETVDFRVKNPAENAGSYDFSATSVTGETRQAPTSTLLGANWGLATFQLEACNFCDDVFAETADITFGDAWLPEFVSDWRGHNVIVTRHPLLAEIIEDGVTSGQVSRHDIGPDRSADSQAGNFRHRREGLQLRLHDDQSAGKWTPRKRVEATADINEKRKPIVRQRRELASTSHLLFEEAKELGSLEHFTNSIEPQVKSYMRLYREPFPKRAARWGFRQIMRLLRLN
ncbi:coenzyme F420 hydrogenase [Flaviflexus ciconiae]|uniref:Coenzyme F420 hydrogenase n=1 Tax=Flaviflexus ciconiae TaxID=2496867 RepID=A0A3Q9G6B0_9ACTO|nr:Coenzyme F420 hydrogenase/dehydrogenase, beta subunit C-terminal domain [Flaviflexus ciconiae]AZQ76762.1 coenzyme F420 hydrogenase [Flaviflexus ciconiae]